MAPETVPESAAATHNVVVVLYDGIQMLDVTGPVDAFTSANALGAHYRIVHVSITGGDVVASSGARLGVDTAADLLTDRIDTLLVPGAPDWQASITNTDLVDTMRVLAQRSRRTVSICAGAFPWRRLGSWMVGARPRTGSWRGNSRHDSPTSRSTPRRYSSPTVPSPRPQASPQESTSRCRSSNTIMDRRWRVTLPGIS